MADVYLYGMILATNSFMVKGDFLEADSYSELSEKYRLPGGETGDCATILAGLGVDVKVDGNHIGKNVAPLVRRFYDDKSVDISSLCFDLNYDGLEEYVVIGSGKKSSFGSKDDFHNNGQKRWNIPKEGDVSKCKVAAIDPYFEDGTEAAAELCNYFGKPYVTIDCRHDEYVFRHAAVTIISGDGLKRKFAGKTPEEAYELLTDNGEGLVIITGGDNILYGRRGGEMNTRIPFTVEAICTEGADNAFKAGCVYGLLKGMDDNELVCFAAACAAVAVTKFPLAINPPKLEDILALEKQ